MNTPIKLFLLVLGFIASSNAFAAKNYDWQGDTDINWEESDNWTPALGTALNEDYVVNPDNYTGASLEPSISNAAVTGVRRIEVANGAVLTIENTLEAEGILIREGGQVVVNAGANVTLDFVYIFDDASELQVNNGAFTVNNDIVLGETVLGRPDGTNGTPILRINGGNVACDNISYKNLTGDTPLVDINGGTVNITNDVTADPTDTERVNLDISGGTLNIGNNLIMNAGSDILTMSGGTINLIGNWNLDGTTSISDGSINFNGSNQQSVTSSGSYVIGFHDIDLNNTSGISPAISFNNNIEIDGNLNFQSGLLESGATLSRPNITFTNGASASNFDGTMHVAGRVFKTGASAFTFPLIRPIGVSAGSADAQFEAEYYGTNPDAMYSVTTKEASIVRVSRLEYWILDRPAGSASTYAVTLFWDGNSEVQTPADLLVARWDGTEWKNQGNASFDAGNQTVTSTVSVNSFSPFTLASSTTANTLPIKLISFDAQLTNDEQVELVWATATEKNNSYFEIQRSSDLQRIEVIKTLISKAENGNSNSRLDYLTYDEEPLEGSSYYRLKQIDYDGKFSYSPFVHVKNEKAYIPPTVAVYPNPIVNNRIYIKTEDVFEQASFVLLNNYGIPQAILVQDEVQRFYIIDPDNILESGNYILQSEFIDGQGIKHELTHKLIVE